MHTKLKIEIKLYTEEVVGPTSKFPGYFIKLTVLDKDDRFEACNGGIVGDYLRFGGSGFAIKSNSNKKFGSLNSDSLILPHLDKMGFPYTKIFTSDIERYNYLKQLYECIRDWSNYWWGFEDDSTSKIVVDGNIWEVVCETANLKIMDKAF